MAASSREQEQRFYGFIGELNNFWHDNADAEILIRRIDEAFDAGELTTSSMIN